MYASSEGHLSVVELLLAKGAALEAKNNKGKTALDWARVMNHSDVIALLEAAPKVQGAAMASTKEMNLLDAAKRGDVSAVGALIERGAALDAKSNGGLTPLIIASMNGHLSVVELLLAKGAALEAKDGSGWTPLMYASARGHASVLEVLLAKGAALEAKSNNGKAALDWARVMNHSDVIALLEAAPKVQGAAMASTEEMEKS